MKKIHLILLGLLAILSFSAQAENQVMEEEAIVLATKFMGSAKPTLKLTKDSAIPSFVAAGPQSGGGPKWVIGLTAVDTKTKEKDIYYVTVFPNGKTDGQIRVGPKMGGVSK